MSEKTVVSAAPIQHSGKVQPFNRRLITYGYVQNTITYGYGKYG